MDLLASSSDDESTLRAVLTFIECAAYDDSGSSGSGSSLDVSPSVSPPTCQPPRSRKEKYTTQLQRKKRAEVAALREQTAELEGLLAQLRRIHASRESKSAMPSNQGDARHDSKEAPSSITWESAGSVTRWRDVALKEHQKRRRAELVNGRLKAALQRHRYLGDAILNMLKKRSGEKVRLQIRDGIPLQSATPRSHDRAET